MPIEQVVDVTGAGDLFAAGFLVGLARGKDNRTSARLGALAAAEVIQHIGARPAVSLKALAAENGLPVYDCALNFQAFSNAAASAARPAVTNW